MDKINYREIPETRDLPDIKEVLQSTEFFHDYEIPIALELIEEYLSKGPQCGYRFVFADIKGKTVGYTCYGEIPCTSKSFDLYWIAVHKEQRGTGIGKTLLAKTEELIKREEGRRIYIETSSRELYYPTRQFYLKCNYLLEATLKDFYATGDDKCIFSRSID